MNGRRLFNQISSRLREKSFLTIALPLAILVSVITVSRFAIDTGRKIETVNSNERNHALLLKETISADFESVVSDLMILSENEHLQDFMGGEDAQSYEVLSQEFLTYATRKGLYDQIRFLDETGMEMVRVNFNVGDPIIVPRDQLQFKGERYYFQDAYQLESGQVFVSPFDLNIEHGEIEQPLKPMIRFGTPVFDSRGQKEGIVILNYFGALLIENFEGASTNVLGHIYLVNADGYFLKGITPEEEWGFMYPDGDEKTFGNSYPDAWEEITKAESGQFNNADGQFTFETVHTLLEAWKSSSGSGEAFEPSTTELGSREYFWKVVLHIPTETLNATTRGNVNELLILDAGLIIAVAAGALISARESKKRKRAEGALRESAARLEASNRELSDFAHIVSHDLKTPLRGISQLAGWIKEDYVEGLDEGGKEKLGLLIDQAKRMHQLIDTILQYSRVGRVEAVERRVDLNQLVQETIEILAPPKSMRISVINELPTMVGVRSHFEQVFQNLLSNAINFMDKAEGFIKIDCVEEEDDWLFSVKDNGPGIEEDHHDRIFQIFQTLARREEVESTGIGLALVKKIVETWGGRIWVESKKGEGSTFFFTLPKIGESNERA
jgi:signal transduction histidine kinase